MVETKLGTAGTAAVVGAAEFLDPDGPIGLVGIRSPARILVGGAAGY